MQDPIVYQFPDAAGVQEFGITGTAIWAESHMTIHTWPELDYFSCDLYSCKEFDTERAKELLDDWFGITSRAGISVTRSESLNQQVEHHDRNNN